MKYGIQRLISGLVRDLWLAEAPAALATVQAYRDIDLDLTPLDPHAGQPVRAA